ncbi:MAG TPA: glycosyltransferase family 39 protein [Acidimicrobiales bacterium]|nr:glycosyltransferase family 39 protein [Acidimicrobiales bacterium]
MTLTLDRPVIGDAVTADVPPAPAGSPAWERPAFAALLAATAVLYLWGLGASGWANSFYSAAVQAGTHSLKAAFFGASDAAGSITVDKSPLFLWPMEVSARIFGVNSWSILVPNALEGVASVAFLYAAVKRWFGAPAGLVAGAVLALTPVAVLMFRFNNPDAVLVLLLTAAGYAMVRALEHGATKWVAMCFALVGLGFLAKMMQAFLVVPAFGFAYLLAGPPKLGRRIAQLAIGAAAMLGAFAWWVAAVELTPKSWRPYVGGSQNNSVLNLIFGYNGFGRLTGNESGSVGGQQGPRGTTMWGPTGLFRMFNSAFGGQASWLIPAALVLLAVGLVATAGRDRRDRTRAALMIWGGWLVVTALTFSLGKGIIHEYYTVALAPGIGGTVAVGGALLWRERSAWWARIAFAATVAVTAVWSIALLARTPNWLPWLAPLVFAAAAVTMLLLLIGHLVGPKVIAGAAIAAVGVGLIGPAAYSLDTAAAAHSGALPTAGPAGQGRSARGPGGFAGGPPAGQFGGRFGGPPPFAAGNGGGTTAPGGAGGLLNASTPSAELTAYLLQDAGKYTWIAATVGANEASGYQLATDKSVMPIGGFNGTDPSPTLAQFQQWVRAGKIHYFISGGNGGRRFGPAGGNQTGSTSAQISSWVTSTFSSTTVGGVTVYDLTRT